MSEEDKTPRGENSDPKLRLRDAGSRMTPNAWMAIVLISLCVIIALLLSALNIQTSEVTYSFFREQLAKDPTNVEFVEFLGEDLSGRWKEPPTDPKTNRVLNKAFSTTMPSVEDRELIPLLEKQKVQYRSIRITWGPGTMILVSLIGPLLIIGFFWYTFRRSNDPMSAGGMFGNFGRSPARRFSPSSQATTFKDVADMENAKQELVEVVEFLKNPTKFQRLGATIPKGILLMGPPGTGKTLMARATAGEAGVSFFSINGSEFIQMFVGVGASRVRDLFQTAKENSPCVIFIDEIDAVGRVRGAGVGGGHDEREQTLNQILSEMDGFAQSDAVIVLAATNRPDVLDPALLRPGRFDRHVTVDRPTRKGRFEVLKVHCRKVPLSDNVDLQRIADSTIGFSGADLKNLVNEAALLATRAGKNSVEMDDFEAARDKVLMGPKREEILNQHEREMTAYHEAGHALLAWVLPDVDSVHKVTIIPRGRALGVTQLLPDEDSYNIGERRLHSQLTFIMGGRAAEKLVFDEFSAGAEDDLKKATQLARRMVGHWGMSEAIGPVAFRQGDEHPFLGKEMSESREFSEATAHVIDQEVQKFLNNASARATQLLTEFRPKLDALARALLEKESIDTEEVKQILGERPPKVRKGAFDA
ncbi:MAG: ATP-dependent zinc metalloprotease FtsH [Planctomycetales bacterium]